MAVPEYVVEAELDSVWTDLTEDVLARVPVRWQRRISGSGPSDVMARPGLMSLALDNSAANSAGLQGYYTPGHANQRSGWMHGTKMRLRIIAGAETAPWFGPPFGGAFGAGSVISRYVFAGKVRRILPSPGTTGPQQQVDVVVEDYLALMQDFDELELSLRENSNYETAVDDVLGEMPERPANEWIDAGSETWPFIFDDLRASASAAAVARDLALSEGPPASIFLRGDDTDGETFRAENRSYRSTTPIRDTFTEADIKAEPGALEVPVSTERVFNDAKIRYTPRDVGSSPEIVVKLQAAIGPVSGSGGTLTRFVDITDPNQRAARMGAKSPVTPVGNTHFTANTAQDGSGTDITADVSVVVTFLGERAKIVITNNNASDGYLRGPGSDDGAEFEGTALRTFSPVRVPDENSASITSFGRQKFEIDMPYNSTQAAAEAVAAERLETYSGLANVPTRVRPLTEKPDILRRALPLDIGDRIAITEDMTAVDEVEVVIVGVTGEISRNVTRIEWDLAPALVSAPLIWDDPDAGKWDERAWGFG